LAKQWCNLRLFIRGTLVRLLDKSFPSIRTLIVSVFVFSYKKTTMFLFLFLKLKFSFFFFTQQKKKRTKILRQTLPATFQDCLGSKSPDNLTLSEEKQNFTVKLVPFDAFFFVS
jgi:hypothetical protein